jgi:mRNA interferase MazF
MRRGLIVTAVLAGDFGKPRPALIVQDDRFAALPSLVVCPLTTTILSDAALFRVDILPTSRNGVREPSQISVDKLAALFVDRIGSVIGVAESEVMDRVDIALARFLGLA